MVKLTQSHWRRRKTHAGASSSAADADVVDRVALGQKPCRLRRQLYSITGFLLFASSASFGAISASLSHVFSLSLCPPFSSSSSSSQMLAPLPFPPIGRVVAGPARRPDNEGSGYQGRRAYRVLCLLTCPVGDRVGAFNTPRTQERKSKASCLSIQQLWVSSDVTAGVLRAKHDVVCSLNDSLRALDTHQHFHQKPRDVSPPRFTPLSDV